MPRNNITVRRLSRSRVCQAVCFGGICFAVYAWLFLLPVHSEDATSSQAEESIPKKSKPEFCTELVKGKVVWQADALKSKFGISTVSEAEKSALAILTPDGELLPIVENERGRAFRKDKRLRDTDMEILVRRYEKQPLVQIIRVYQIEDGQRFEVDYWCDVCAIVMFETGACSCCQDHNRLRKRPVDDDDSERRTLPED